MKKILLLLCLFGIIFAGENMPKAVTPPKALEIAHELDKTTFKGWSYGSYSSDLKHIDCATFVSAVVDTILSREGITYTSAMRNDVLINHPNLGRDVVAEGPDPDDPRFGGVEYAIVKYHWGDRIKDMSQVRPGDFIQYWMRRSNGTWFGHASLIESVRYDKKQKKYKARIFGSHKSMDGIAVSSFELYLSGSDRIVYIGRFKDQK